MIVVKIINHKPVVWTCCEACKNLLDKYAIKLCVNKYNNVFDLC